MKALLMRTAAAMVLALGIAAVPSTAAAATIVTTEAQLRAAFADPDETEIVLGADTTLSCSSDTIVRESEAGLMLRGAGHSITQTCGGQVLYTEGSLTVERVTISGGSASRGGGAIQSNGSVTVLNSTLKGNSSPDTGGAIYTHGSVTINNSTLTDNSSDRGGAVFALGAIAIENSTVTNNVATRGGGVYAAGQLRLNHATLVANTAQAGANLEIASVVRDFESANSVIAKPLGEGQNCRGVVWERSSQGYNFSDDDSCRFDGVDDGQGSGDPQLGELADNGGPTQTRMPKPGSPLIDANRTPCSNPLTTDQRGVSRPQGSGCDIGAVEREAPVNQAPVADDQQVSTDEDAPVEITLSGADPDGDDLSYAVAQPPSHGQLTGDAPRLTYTPNPDYHGPDSFTYQARDAHGATSNAATVRITVNPVNDAPTVAITPGGSCDAELTGTMHLAVADTDGDAVTLAANSSNTSVVPTANVKFAGSGGNRTASISAIPQKRGGSTVITVTATDSHGPHSSVTLTVIAGTTKTETLNGTTGADLIFGVNGNNVIDGGAGNDVICAGNGNDTVSGGDGDDTIDGQKGDDALRGGSGDDTLRGGPGTDSLTGGAGADSFSGGLGTDSATDFNPAEGDTQDTTIP